MEQAREYYCEHTEGIEMSVSSDCSVTNSLQESAEFGGNDDETHDAEEQLAQKESRHVFVLRVVVMMVLFFAACGVSAVVFFITKKGVEDEFETQYEGTAEKILEAFQGVVKQKLGAISSVGVAIIAHGVDHLRSWPFVTLSSFQQRSSTARSLSNALFISVSPSVNETNREPWEKYVVSNDSYWIDEGFYYQKKLGLDGFEPSLERSLSERTLQQGQQQDGEVPTLPIFFLNSEDEIVRDPGPGPYMVSLLW